MALWISVSLWCLVVSGCATVTSTQLTPPTQAIPTLQGSYHQVRRGDTLWRIARSYGLDVHTLAAVNRLSTLSHLAVGQQLFVPLPASSNRFLWPVRGAVHSASRGIAIVAPVGSLVRASRSGRVAVATQRLSGWGKTIVIDHRDGYMTVYAGFEQLLVTPGVDLQQGTPIGTLGMQALHFEIREGVRVKDALALLPSP